MDIVTRVIAALSQASFVLLQNAQSLQQEAGSQPVFARCSSLANAAAEEGNDVVRHFVQSVEQFKRTGGPRLDYKATIVHTAGELTAHLQTLNTIYRSARPRPTLGGLIVRNEAVIQQVEVMLDELTRHPDFQAAAEAIVASYPND